MIKLSESRIRQELAHAEMARLQEHAGRRVLLAGFLAAVTWILIGAVIMASAFHTTDQVWGDILFKLALAVGYGGAFFTILAFYVRGANRDDW